MSLKAIKEALSLARARKGFGDTEDEMLADDAAKAEIAALERAAKIVAKATEAGWPTTHMGVLNLQHSFEVLATIARETE